MKIVTFKDIAICEVDREGLDVNIMEVEADKPNNRFFVFGYTKILFNDTPISRLTSYIMPFPDWEIIGFFSKLSKSQMRPLGSILRFIEYQGFDPIYTLIIKLPTEIN